MVSFLLSFVRRALPLVAVGVKKDQQSIDTEKRREEKERRTRKSPQQRDDTLLRSVESGESPMYMPDGVALVAVCLLCVVLLCSADLFLLSAVTAVC